MRLTKDVLALLMVLEHGKRGTIVREARIPGVCCKKGSKRVPVSFVIVEDFLRRGRSILVGDKVML